MEKERFNPVEQAETDDGFSEKQLDKAIDLQSGTWQTIPQHAQQKTIRGEKKKRQKNSISAEKTI